MAMSCEFIISDKNVHISFSITLKSNYIRYKYFYYFDSDVVQIYVCRGNLPGSLVSRYRIKFVKVYLETKAVIKM